MPSAAALATIALASTAMSALVYQVGPDARTLAPGVDRELSELTSELTPVADFGDFALEASVKEERETVASPEEEEGVVASPEEEEVAASPEEEEEVVAGPEEALEASPEEKVEHSRPLGVAVPLSNDALDAGRANSVASEVDVATPNEVSNCFPARAEVELEGGRLVRMEDVKIGDSVKVGVGEYSRVFMFTHRLADTVNKFVNVRTVAGELELTSGHYLYVNGALAAASKVRVGDVVTLADGKAAAVEKVGSVVREGLYNPQTLSGNIVVNGVLASTYTTAVEPAFAHAVLVPFRTLSNFGISFSGLESGGGALTDIPPLGKVMY